MNITDITAILAYTAGFIDGEGYIGVRSWRSDDYVHGITYLPIVGVGNTNKEVLEWIQEIFGGNLRRRKIIGSRKEFWQLEFSGQSGKEILSSIKPYLKIKSRQAELLLKFYETFPKALFSDKRSPAKITEENFKVRENIFNELKELNKKGSLNGNKAEADQRLDQRSAEARIQDGP